MTGRAGGTEATKVAEDCVRKAVEGDQGRLVRLIRANFKGRPAYLAVFLQAPGAGLAPDKVYVWVVSTDQCEVVSFARKSI
jgi:hypothetical protein